ncbi:helix-turn-helix domain-containing protein [Rothia sp. CCM 9416]|uniref:helix-turn-helix domain-containing protein n=1 Tax=Rothia sp. CCM 9416 TaxID=3402655 RepID=UPI003ADF4372
MSLPIWTLQDRIRKAREHAGLKQEELAQKMETTRQTLGRWENGSHIPTEKNLQALAEATGVPLAWFYQDDSNTKLSAQTGTLPPGSVVEWTPEGLKIS